MNQPGGGLQSLQRGLAMILVFDAEHSRLTLSEAARRAGHTRATARRILHTLVELGYVATDGRTFALRPAILRLGHAYLSSLGLPAIVQPHLQRLTEQVGESTSVAVLDGEDIVYVARAARRAIMTVAIDVGTRLPAHLTSMGRVLLAALPEPERATHLPAAPGPARTPFTITDPRALDAELARIRAQGWALVDQELEEGLRSIAVPLRDPSGVVAAMNISAGARRDRGSLCADLLPALRSAAAAVEADLAAVRG